MAATAATLVGNGLARFAYSPLLPVVIAQGWFTPGAAAYLGAANLLGYLGGALAARGAGRRFGAVPVLRISMLAAGVSMAACCVPLPFAWFFVWRLLSGVVGGLLMILGPSVVLSQVPAARRGFASGVILTGVSIGIAASGTLVPLLLHWGLTEAWLGLAALCLALTAYAWRNWPITAGPAAAPLHAGTVRFTTISLVYGLCALGMVPHMVFLVDFVARGLGWGLNAGALVWVMFGLGALAGPVLSGRLADGLGPASAMRIVIAAEAVSLLLLALSGSPLAVGVSALAAGVVTPGISAVMLGRVSQLAGLDGGARQRGWTQATVAWAIGQVIGAYGMAWLLAVTGGYASVFRLGLAALLAAAAIEAVLAVQLRFRMAA